MIACILSNISAKYYKNPSMLSRVIAKNIGDVFLRHSVESLCYLTLKTARLYFHVVIFIHLNNTPKRDGQTDRHTDPPWLLQRSALRQC